MNIRYVFNNPFKNWWEEEKFTFPATMALIQSFNSQSNTVLPSIYMLIAGARLPMDGRLM